MIRFREFDRTFIAETVNDQVSPQQKGKAAADARRLGLQHQGFGRYGDGTSVTHIVKGDKLVDLDGEPAPDDDKGQEKQKIIRRGVMAGKAADKQAANFRDQQTRSVAMVQQYLANLYIPQLFNPQELKAIKLYTTTMSQAINRYLYKGFDDGMTPDQMSNITTAIANIDSAFEEAGAPFDYTVYTALSARYDPSKVELGSSYTFRGYPSTSLDHNVPVGMFNFSQADMGVLLEIDIKANQKSIYIDNITGSGNKEVILPRGTKIQFVDGPNMADSGSLSGSRSPKNVAVFKCLIIDE